MYQDRKANLLVESDDTDSDTDEDLNSNEDIIKSAFAYACGEGQLDIAKWAYWVIQEQSITLEDYNYINNLTNACTCGNLQLAQWLVEIYPNLVDNISEAFTRACQHGHFQIAQWLWTLNSKSNSKINMAQAFSFTCFSGHVPIASWLLTLKPDLSVINQKIFSHACVQGNLPLAQLLYEHTPNGNWPGQYLISKCTKLSAHMFYDFEKIFIECCRVGGKVDVVAWLLTIKPGINIRANNEDAFRSCCANGHRELAVWLYELNPKINIEAVNDDAFRLSCYHGHLEIAKWLYGLKPNSNVFDWADIFVTICANGHFQVAIWLLTIKPEIATSANIKYAFEKACQYGNLEIAQWLLALNPLIDIYQHGEYILRSCCVRGRLQVVQWLYSIDPNPERLVHLNGIEFNIQVIQWISLLKPDIVITDEVAEELFDEACKEGNVEIAKWLWETKLANTNTSLSVSYFDKACKNQFVELAKWMCTVNPRYKIYIEADIIICWETNPVPISTMRTIPMESIDLEDRTCSICWDGVVSLQTNCTHSFCSRCINHCYRKTDLVNCAYCRSQVIEFYPIK